MMKKTRYNFAIGGIEDLKERDTSRLKVVKTLKEEDLAAREGILIPQFCGVYQDQEIVPDVFGEYPAEIKGIQKKVIGMLIETSKRFEQPEEEINPDLIHIIYDSALPAGVMHDFLKTRRVAFSPYNKMPDFGMKDVGIYDRIAMSVGGSYRLTQKQGEEYRKILRGQLERFGLTAPEFAFFKIADAANARHSNLIIDPVKSGLMKKIVEMLGR